VKKLSSACQVVEFMSVPGAGKTTFLPVAREFFVSQGFHARTVMEAARPFALRTRTGRLVGRVSPPFLRDPLLWQVFYQTSKVHQYKFHRENRLLMDSTLAFQHHRPLSPIDRHHVIHWFVNLTGQFSFLNKNARANDLLLFDEGFAHRVVQLFASESETPGLERVTSYLDLIPQPDLVIHPRASLQTCIERVRRRGVWERFRSKEDGALNRFMENARTVVNFSVNYLIAKGWNIVEVENDHQTTEQAAVFLRQKLASLYAYKTEFVTFAFGV
jgi:hypothetical protein